MVRNIKKSSNTDEVFKQRIIILLEVAVLLTLIILIVAVFKSGVLSFEEETTIYITTQQSSENTTGTQDEPVLPSEKSESDTYVSESVSGNYTYPANDKNDSGNLLPNPSGWSESQILSKAKDAVNKTKAYTHNLTVNHSETFSANVTECSAGGIVRTVVDLMIGWVVKPVQETLIYENGRAINSEGESVPVMLPKKNNFSLTEKGVKSASVQLLGNEYLIRINLIEESVGMYDVPKHNASSIGYLDIANFDLSFMEIDSADIVYKGSSVELRINAEGFVTYANYRIPLHIEGSAHKGAISGSATFEGEQTETWIFNY